MRHLLLFVASISYAAGVRTIDTSNAILRLAEGSGDLVGVTWKNPGIEIIREPRLGENFRILLPKPGYEASYFNSREQQVSRIEAASDGVVCHYDALRNAREQIPVKVRYTIRSAGPQLQFSIEIDNPTERKLAEVVYGILGGLTGVGGRLDTETMIPGGTNNAGPALFHRFRGGAYGGGNLGIRHEAAAYTYPGVMSMGWMDVYNRKSGAGFYYANQDPEWRFQALYTELHPFTKSASVGDNWPSPADVPEGEPIGLTLTWVNFPYVARGRWAAGPIALQAHTGDWHAASAIYRSWFDRHFTVQRQPTWLRREMAWQSVIISNPEDVIVHRFRDLPKLAADAKKYGVTTFEILGWDIGGIDRGYPQYRPDPRLGTPEEFRRALAEIRAMGVHPLIFSNIQVADTATDLFRTNLSRYTVTGRWAPDWPIVGWGEGTISARMGLTRSNSTLVSPAHPEFRKFLIDQYLDLIRAGTQGLQLDKALIVGMLDFNRRLTIGPDRSLPWGVAKTFEELLQQARKIDPEFALASEIWADRYLPYVDVSYMRMNDVDMGSPALRYTFPEWTATIFGEGPGDFNPMNNGMRYGLVWALAPRHYNDSVDETLTRPLARYVGELIRIRTRRRDLLFEGRFKDTIGAVVAGDPDIRFSVFEPMRSEDARRACVVVNFGDRPETAEVRFPGAEGRQVEIDTPFEPVRKSALPARLTLPPRRCAVVVLQ